MKTKKEIKERLADLKEGCNPDLCGTTADCKTLRRIRELEWVLS